MADTIRWTVRGVNPDTIERIAEVSGESKCAYGLLVDEAVEVWFGNLPFAEEEDEVDEEALFDRG